MARYDGCMLIVKDVRASRRFYEEVLQVGTVMDLETYVVFEGGFSAMDEREWTGFTGKAGEGLVYRHYTAELYFEEDNLEDYLRHLASFPEVEIVTSPASTPWGQRTIRFHDPDGHVVEVGESMKVVIKNMLRSGLSVDETVKKSLFPPEFVRACRDELAEEKQA